ncbi:hypothetical protein Hdeb2414_s0009g00299711 [Helianthus debilis subsp. tardiflorus]
MIMRLPMVDCRGLVEFCRAFKNMKPTIIRSNHSQNVNKSFCYSNSVKSLHQPLFREQSSFATLDILMLLLVLGALGFLIIPYINNVYHESIGILPLAFEVIGDVILEAPVAYLVGLIAVFSGVIASIVAWDICETKSRKCGKLKCKGLRKAIEFDIHLESEECVKYSSRRMGHHGLKHLELGKDHKELKAELKKMAPVNGRTVLIFRGPCGCPVGTLEVWGAKRVRRVKK